MVIADARFLASRRIFFLFSDPPKDFLVSQRNVVVGQTVLSVKTDEKNTESSMKYTAMIGEMIPNNALVPRTECFIYSFQEMHRALALARICIAQ